MNFAFLPFFTFSSNKKRMLWANYEWRKISVPPTSNARQGKINSRRRPISWLRNLTQWTGETSTSLFGWAVDKVICATMIANISWRYGTRRRKRRFLVFCVQLKQTLQETIVRVILKSVYSMDVSICLQLWQ